MTKWQIVRRIWALVSHMENEDGLSVLRFALAVRDRDRKQILAEALRVTKRIQNDINSH